MARRKVDSMEEEAKYRILIIANIICSTECNADLLKVLSSNAGNIMVDYLKGAGANKWIIERIEAWENVKY